MGPHTHRALPFPSLATLTRVLSCNLTFLSGLGQQVALNSGTFHLVKHLQGLVSTPSWLPDVALHR